VQLNSVLDDIKIGAMKTGMLHNAETVHTIAETLETRYSHSGEIRPPLICDPVSVSTSGHELLSLDAIQTLIREIFPLATLITPNKSEAELILSSQGVGTRITNIEEMLAASSSLLSLGPEAVLLKGGHVTTTLADLDRFLESHTGTRVVKHALLDENMEILRRNRESIDSELVVDLLQESAPTGTDDYATTLFVGPRIDSTSTHGTGCTLSAAITGGIAQGLSCS
jgi:hydroxymethylpyrimidine/phosphomethylpyrimidine kinase